MSSPGLLPAVEELVRRLREFFSSHGHPPVTSSWEFVWGESHPNPHPLATAGPRFSWLLGDPDQDTVLQLCIERFEPLRRTALALKRVESLLGASDPRLAHFRTVWRSLLNANWLRTLTNAETFRIEDAATWFSVGFTAEAADPKLLTELIEAAGLTEPGARRKGQRSAPGVQRDGKADERDKWMYQHATGKKPKTFKTIMLKLKQVAGAKGWTPLGSPTAVQQAINRYVERNGLDPLPPRKQA